jgi:hypothetical protein
VPVTAADIAAGDMHVALVLETFHLSSKGWTADQFTMSLELEGCTAAASTQFLRTLVTDCETGEVVSTTDTTLDGQPYTVTGDVGQCTPANSPQDCQDCEHLVLCDVVDGAPTVSFLRSVCRDCAGVVTSTVDTDLDGTTPYDVAGTVGECEPPEPPKPESCCQPVQVCIEQDPEQEVEFISNAAHLNDSSVDPVWKWTTDLTAANPPWYDMYEYQYSTAWSVVDSDTARPAWWVSPHPNGASTPTGSRAPTSTCRPTPTPPPSSSRPQCSTPTRSAARSG